MSWPQTTVNVLYYILYPVYLLLRLVVLAVLWLISPFIYLSYVVKELFLGPFRFLARFEALWYFLGCAILIGTLTGLLLHGILHLLVVTFDLNRKTIPPSIPARGHDAVSYRAARQAKKDKVKEKEYRQAVRASLIASQPLMQQAVQEARNRSGSSKPLSPTGLLQETILEHTDEEDDDSAI